MPLSRADVEGQLIARLGPMLKLCGLNGVTKDGTNPDLNDPIRVGIRYDNYDILDSVNVTDQDLVVFSGWQIERLIDVAELRLSETLWGNWPFWTFTISLEKKDLSDVADRLQKRIEFLKEKLSDPYGPNVGGGAVGMIAVGHRIPRDQGQVVNWPPGNYGNWYGWNGGCESP